MVRGGNMAMKHKHHIIPRHMGGTDDPQNLVEVSVEQHAELHFSLYLEYGRWQDYRAACGLAGLGGWEDTVGYGFKDRHHTDEVKQRISNKLKQRVLTEEHKSKIGAKHKGKVISQNHRNTLQKLWGKVIHIDGVEYPSIRAAARELQCSTNKIYRLMGENPT